MKIKNEAGFTLLEILIVVGIIAILTGAILTSIAGQREKARVSKVLTEISARLQPMMMCWSDGNGVNTPGTSGGGSICYDTSTNNDLSAYGQWPDVSSLTGFSINSTITNSSAWYIRIDGSDSRICCNSATAQCGVIDPAVNCEADSPVSF